MQSLNEPVESHGREKQFAIAIILISLAAGAGSFYALYTQLILPGSSIRQIEYQAASNAVDNVTVTCISDNVEPSVHSNSTTDSITLGVRNPSNLPIDTTWNLAFNYSHAYVYVNSTQTFHLPPNTTMYPIFNVTFRDYQWNALQYAVDRSYSAVIDATFRVTGTHGVYMFVRASLSDSSTRSTEGSFGSSLTNNNLSACP